MKKKIFWYVIAFAVALALVLLVCGLNGLLTEQKTEQETAKILCDAFFVAAALFMGFSGLSWASGTGAFDGLGYSVSLFFDVHLPTKRRLTWEKKETYQEYVERKHGKDAKEKNKTLIFLLVVGAAFLVIAIAMLIWYNSFE